MAKKAENFIEKEEKDKEKPDKEKKPKLRQLTELFQGVSTWGWDDGDGINGFHGDDVDSIFKAIGELLDELG